jgi:hypothetical protein
MINACPAWEFATYTEALAKQGSPHTGKFPKCTPVRELIMAFQVPYICVYITKLCRQQAEITQNHENANARDIGKGEARHRKCKRLMLGGGKACDRSSD